MRYCPNCKKEVNTTLTPGQVVVMLILLPTVILFLLYCAFHERKCCICKTETEPIYTDTEKTANGFVAYHISLTPFNCDKYLKIEKLMKDKKIAGYEISGIKNDLYIYEDAYLMIDKKRAIQIDLDKKGNGKCYFNRPANDEEAEIYFVGGKLRPK